MRVFLSWSGEHSHEVAQAFYDWLPTVVQSVDPWLSSADIEKGASWLPELRTAIQESQGFGIFFMTAEAGQSPWLLYEAGGIAVLDAKRVCTVLIGIEQSGLPPPLTHYQATKLEKGDVLKLLKSINERSAAPLTEAQLKTAFGRGWPELETALKEIRPRTKPNSTMRAPKTAEELDMIAEAVRGIEARLGRLEEVTQKASEETTRAVRRIVVELADMAQAARFGVVGSGLSTTLGTSLVPPSGMEALKFLTNNSAHSVLSGANVVSPGLTIGSNGDLGLGLSSVAGPLGGALSTPPPGGLGLSSLPRSTPSVSRSQPPSPAPAPLAKVPRKK